MKKITLLVVLLVVITILVIGISSSQKEPDIPVHTPTNVRYEHPNVISYELNPKTQNIQFFSTDDTGVHFRNHGNLKKWLSEQGIELVFAVNGGMYLKDLSAQGLFIENGVNKKNINAVKEGYGNFYLQPNGIFSLSNDMTAQVISTDSFKNDNIKYATQSGPMLVIDGEIHPIFDPESKNFHIRNGVGILPNGNILFAMSKEKTCFYDLADFFLKNQCQNALYLDGFVSRTYLPAKDWMQEDGVYGIIIAEIK